MEIHRLNTNEIPPQLLEIPQPPKELWVAGTLPSKDAIYLVVVGSRKHTNYGKDICEKLIKGLRGYPIVILSGLALGIDSVAHRSALDAGLITMAVPGSGLSEKVLYPASNIGLARKIIESGGCLLSEFPPEFKATVWSFPQRNRIMAGLAKAVLTIEAEEKSGTLITARLATEYNRDVLAVPGSVFSESSQGTNKLLRLGATPITCPEDLIEALGFDIPTEVERSMKKEMLGDLSEEEKTIYELLREPTGRDELLRKSGLSITKASAILSIMEIKGIIKESMGEIKRI